MSGMHCSSALGWYLFEDTPQNISIRAKAGGVRRREMKCSIQCITYRQTVVTAALHSRRCCRSPVDVDVFKTRSRRETAWAVIYQSRHVAAAHQHLPVGLPLPHASTSSISALCRHAHNVPSTQFIQFGMFMEVEIVLLHLLSILFFLFRKRCQLNTEQYRTATTVMRRGIK